MKQLKEWQKHIYHPFAKNRTLCGEYIVFHWCFQDAQHAFLNGFKGGRLTVCPSCAQSVAKAMNGEYHETEGSDQSTGEG